MKKNRSSLWLMFSSLMLLGCSNDDAPVEPQVKLRPVKSIVLSSQNPQRSYEFNAVVDAYRKADLSFKVSGEITEFLVKQGDAVKEGDVIARLNDTDISILLDEAKSSYQRANADFNRAKSLIKTNYISTSEFEQLKATASSARAQLSTAENNLKYTQLRASFDGMIAKTYTEAHQEINAKKSVVRLHDLSQIKLQVDIPESLMIRLRKNSSQGVIEAQFNAISEKKFPITFSEVSTLADEESKSYQVTFTMDAPKEYIILPGMTAVVTAYIDIESALEASYYLPANTVLKDSKNHYVYTVKKIGTGRGEIIKKHVTIGDITPLGIEIFSGLSDGDAVLSAGMSKVADGMLVKI